MADHTVYVNITAHFFNCTPNIIAMKIPAKKKTFLKTRDILTVKGSVLLTVKGSVLGYRSAN